MRVRTGKGKSDKRGVFTGVRFALFELRFLQFPQINIDAILTLFEIRVAGHDGDASGTQRRRSDDEI